MYLAPVSLVEGKTLWACLSGGRPNSMCSSLWWTAEVYASVTLAEGRTWCAHHSDGRPKFMPRSLWWKGELYLLVYLVEGRPSWTYCETLHGIYSVYVPEISRPNHNSRRTMVLHIVLSQLSGSSLDRAHRRCNDVCVVSARRKLVERYALLLAMGLLLFPWPCCAHWNKHRHCFCKSFRRIALALVAMY